jgi:hypothetical protein
VLTKSEEKKVDSWRWRMVKACGTMEEFANLTKRPQSQISEWVNKRKTPTAESIAAVESDLKSLGA